MIVKSVGDENVVVDSHTRVARLYERDERGGWKMVREWTCRRQCPG